MKGASQAEGLVGGQALDLPGLCTPLAGAGTLEESPAGHQTCSVLGLRPSLGQRGALLGPKKPSRDRTLCVCSLPAGRKRIPPLPWERPELTVLQGVENQRSRQSCPWQGCRVEGLDRWTQLSEAVTLNSVPSLATQMMSLRCVPEPHSEEH